MIYLYKILPALLSPYLLFFVCIIVGLIKRKYVIIWSALIILLVLSMPVVSSFFYAQFEKRGTRKTPAAIQPADAIVVLSGMTQSVLTTNGIISEWNDPDRFFGGMELIKANKAPVIIFTKAKIPWIVGPPEFELLQKTAMEMGLPSSRILITGEVENTEDEAREVSKLLQDKRRRIILVTSASHMSRALINFRNKGLDVQAYPVDFKLGEGIMTPMDFIPNPGSLSTIQKCVRELMGAIYYRMKIFVKL